MSDTLMICDFVASMRHAGYVSFAAAVLGLAEAHYPELRNAVRRARAWLELDQGFHSSVSPRTRS